MGDGMKRRRKYGVIYVCTACDEAMSYSDMMYSHGLCHACGHVSGSTVCATKTVMVVCDDPPPWWKFWAKPEWRRLGR